MKTLILVLTCPAMSEKSEAEMPEELLPTIERIDNAGAKDATLNDDALKVIFSDGFLPPGSWQKTVANKGWIVQETPGPSGAAHGLWRALNFADAMECERLLLFEDDIFLAKDAVTRMLETSVPDHLSFISFIDSNLPSRVNQGLNEIPFWYTVGSRLHMHIFAYHQAVLLPRRTFQSVASRVHEELRESMDKHERFFCLGSKDVRMFSDVYLGVAVATEVGGAVVRNAAYGVVVPTLVRHIGRTSRTGMPPCPHAGPHYEGDAQEASVVPSKDENR